MTKRGELPQSNRHVMIYDQDWEFLTEMYGPRGINRSVSISEVVKKIVHQKITAMRQAIVDKSPGG